MGHFKVERLTVNGTELALKNLTVIVGPNNAGKSLALKELSAYILGPERTSLSVRDVHLSMPETGAEFLNLYSPEIVEDDRQTWLNTLASDFSGSHRQPVGSDWRTSLDRHLSQQEDYQKAARNLSTSYFGRVLVADLSVEHRRALGGRVEARGRYGEKASLLHSLYYRDQAEELLLSKLTHEAFGLEVMLDYSSPGWLALRVAPEIVRPVDQRTSHQVLSGYPLLDEQGDGIRSFVGLLLAVIAEPRPLTLLDEPEAFLHPPQAYILGRLLADRGLDGRQMIVSTHSADFVRGALSAGQDLQVVRLDRTPLRATCLVLEDSTLESIIRDPFLSSSRILSGVFFQGTVVVEADADRAFYEAVARKVFPGDDIHYVHAHNKQTLYKAVRPYKDLGIPVAAIADIDILRNASEFRTLLTSMCSIKQLVERAVVLQGSIAREVGGIPIDTLLAAVQRELSELVHSFAAPTQVAEEDALTLSRIQRTLNRLRKNASTWDVVKQRGSEALSQEGKRRFMELAQICANAGLYIVGVGELESWLVEFGVQKVADKSRWISSALEYVMRTDITTASDIGRFLAGVHGYLKTDR